MPVPIISVGDRVLVPSSYFAATSTAMPALSKKETMPQGDDTVEAVVYDLSLLQDAVQVVRCGDFYRVGFSLVLEALVPLRSVRRLSDVTTSSTLTNCNCPCFPTPQEDAAALAVPAWMRRLAAAHSPPQSSSSLPENSDVRRCSIQQYDGACSCCSLTELRLIQQHAFRVMQDNDAVLLPTTTSSPRSSNGHLSDLLSGNSDDSSTRIYEPNDAAMMPHELVAFSNGFTKPMFLCGSSSTPSTNKNLKKSSIGHDENAATKSSASSSKCRVVMVSVTPSSSANVSASLPTNTTQQSYGGLSSRSSIGTLTSSTPTASVWTRAQSFETVWRLRWLDVVASMQSRHHHNGMTTVAGSQSMATSRKNGPVVKKLVFVIQPPEHKYSMVDRLVEELASMLRFSQSLLASTTTNTSCSNTRRVAAASTWQHADETAAIDTDWVICPWTAQMTELLSQRPSGDTLSASANVLLGETDSDAVSIQSLLPPVDDFAAMLDEIRSSTPARVSTTSLSRRQTGDDKMKRSVSTTNMSGESHRQQQHGVKLEEEDEKENARLHLQRFMTTFHVVSWVDPRNSSNNPSNSSSSSSSSSSPSSTSGKLHSPVLLPDVAANSSVSAGRRTVDDAMALWMEGKEAQLHSANETLIAAMERKRRFPHHRPLKRGRPVAAGVAAPVAEAGETTMTSSDCCYCRAVFVYSMPSTAAALPTTAPPPPDLAALYLAREPSTARSVVVCPPSYTSLIRCCALVGSPSHLNLHPTIVGKNHLSMKRSRSADQLQEQVESPHELPKLNDHDFGASPAPRFQSSGSATMIFDVVKEMPSSSSRRRLSLDDEHHNDDPAAENHTSSHVTTRKYAIPSDHHRPSFSLAQSVVSHSPMHSRSFFIRSRHSNSSGAVLSFEDLRRQWVSIADDDLFIPPQQRCVNQNDGKRPPAAVTTTGANMTSPIQRLLSLFATDLADMRTEPPLQPRLLIIRVVPWGTCMSTSSSLDRHRRSERLRQNALMVSLEKEGGQRRCFAPRLPLFDNPSVASSLEAMTMNSFSSSSSSSVNALPIDVTMSKEWQLDAQMIQQWVATKANNGGGGILLLTVPDRIDLSIPNNLQKESPTSQSLSSSRARSSLLHADPAQEAAELALTVRTLSAAMNADGIIVIEDDVASALSNRLGRWATAHLRPIVELRRQLSSRPPRLVSMCSELLLKFPRTGGSDLIEVQRLLREDVRFSMSTMEDDERRPNTIIHTAVKLDIDVVEMGGAEGKHFIDDHVSDATTTTLRDLASLSRIV